MELAGLCNLDATLTAAVQVIDVCRRANPRLVIKRAKFSALVRRELEQSVQTLGLPDENASKAVDARQEIDLRIGASFTRFQTLLLQVQYPAYGLRPLSARDIAPRDLCVACTGRP